MSLVVVDKAIFTTQVSYVGVVLIYQWKWQLMFEVGQSNMESVSLDAFEFVG